MSSIDPQRILIVGGTGFIGRELGAKLSQKGHSVIILTRNQTQAMQKISFKCEFIEADINKGPFEHDLLQNIDSVINLSGENVGAGRWTKARKQKILESREQGVLNLLLSLKPAIKLKTYIGASAIGIYGSRKDEILNEESSLGTDFLANVCRHWESASGNSQQNFRKVTFRLGLVLSGQGGALEKILFPYRIHCGGPLGSGKQWMSWIHLHDLVQLITSALIDQSFIGVYNAVAPEPAQNIQFDMLLKSIFGFQVGVAVPEKLLRIMLGEQAELILSSQNVQARRLLSHRFKFQFPSLKQALLDCCGTM